MIRKLDLNFMHRMSAQYVDYTCYIYMLVFPMFQIEKVLLSRNVANRVVQYLRKALQAHVGLALEN